MSSEPEEATEFLMEQNPAERERLAKFWRDSAPRTSARRSSRRAARPGPPGSSSAGAARARRAPAPNGCGHRPLMRRAHRADRRDRARRARGDDRGRVRAARRCIRATQRPIWVPSRRRVEWHNGAVAQAFSAEDPGKPARAAILRRLVRRARQVAPCRSDLRHAAVRAAPWRAAAAGDHHHAAADRAC